MFKKKMKKEANDTKGRKGMAKEKMPAKTKDPKAKKSEK